MLCYNVGSRGNNVLIYLKLQWKRIDMEVHLKKIMYIEY